MANRPFWETLVLFVGDLFAILWIIELEEPPLDRAPTPRELSSPKSYSMDRRRLRGLKPRIVNRVERITCSMKSLFVRVLAVTIAATALAACGNSNAIVPSAQRVASVPTNAALGNKATPSPCDPPGQFWYFRGSCKAYAMKPGGTKVALDTYHGITFTMIWPGDNPPNSNNSFVTGDAIGNGDITGTYISSVFPLYGTTKCINQSFLRTPCIGKAFLYTVTANATSYEIGWDHAPKVVITNTKAYPGNVCQEISLLYSPSQKKWFWQIWPTQGKPASNTLVIPAWDAPLSLSSDSALLLGVMCH